MSAKLFGSGKVVVCFCNSSSKNLSLAIESNSFFHLNSTSLTSGSHEALVLSAILYFHFNILSLYVNQILSAIAGFHALSVYFLLYKDSSIIFQSSFKESNDDIIDLHNQVIAFISTI